MKTYNFGIYYNPAEKHYDDNSIIGVQCDKCKRTGLKVCIGWRQKFDLCMQCVSDIEKKKNNNLEEPVCHTMMEQNLFKTRMLQNQYNDDLD